MSTDPTTPTTAIARPPKPTAVLVPIGDSDVQREARWLRDAGHTFAASLLEALWVQASASDFLFALLDDIDRASDIAKSDDVGYRAVVERIQRRRFEVADTDGYVVAFKGRS